MKKVWAVCALALIICLSLAACGSINPSDYVTLGQYKGVTVEFSTDYSVTDAEVEAAIKEQLTTDATETKDVTGRGSAKGDTVVVDYVGKLNNVAFDNGSATNQSITLGSSSNSYIEGFEEALYGHKAGETFDAKITFPDPYENNPDLAGKETVFTFTINKVTTPVLPELTDEYVSGAYNYETVAAWKAALKESLSADKKSTAESQRITDVWNAVIANCKFGTLPQSELDAYVKDQMQQIEDYASQYQTNVSTMLAQQGYTEETYKDQLKVYAESYVKEKLTLQAIANAENLNITDQEYLSEAKSLAEANSLSTVKDLESNYGKDSIRLQLLYDRVMDFLVKNAKTVAPGTLSSAASTSEAASK